MLIENLMESLPTTYTSADRDLIMRAYKAAEQAHREQKRASGEPYINHCVAVAGILAELRVPPDVVAAALLHDTVEDTDVTLDTLRSDFGGDIAKMVDGVTKLTHLPRVSRGDQWFEEEQETDLRPPNGKRNVATDVEPEQRAKSRKRDLVSETLRKTFLAMGDDVRVVLIKLADRLHNMRTLAYMPEENVYGLRKETLDIFAPLANRLGIWQIKWELEDLSFRYVYPEKYRRLPSILPSRTPDCERRCKRSSGRCMI
jgi:GTP pyrophosphokinase